MGIRRRKKGLPILLWAFMRGEKGHLTKKRWGLGPLLERKRVMYYCSKLNYWSLKWALVNMKRGTYNKGKCALLERKRGKDQILIGVFIGGERALL